MKAFFSILTLAAALSMGSQAFAEKTVALQSVAGKSFRGDCSLAAVEIENAIGMKFNVNGVEYNATYGQDLQHSLDSYVKSDKKVSVTLAQFKTLGLLIRIGIDQVTRQNESSPQEIKLTHAVQSVYSSAKSMTASIFFTPSKENAERMVIRAFTLNNDVCLIE